jgi:type IV pilus assembly protein PilE
MKTYNSIKRQAGMNLIELAIVAAIIVTLGAIAYPNYTEHVLRTRRSECEGVMLTAAALMERKHSVQNKYIYPDASLPLPAQCPRDGNKKTYTLGYTITAPDNSAFTITATPISPQTADKCGILTLTSTGAKTADGSAANAAACW